MRKMQQLKKWLKGEPVHNDRLDQCVPDFSCCDGSLATKEVREEFMEVYKNREKDPKAMKRFKTMCLDFACQIHPKESDNEA